MNTGMLTKKQSSYLPFGNFVLHVYQSTYNTNILVSLFSWNSGYFGSKDR